MSPTIAVQGALAASALLVLAFAPPAQGRMLVASLDGQPVAEAMLRRARATPLGPGPLPGSMIVDGERAPLAGMMMSEGILVLAAPAPLCSSPVSGEMNS